MFVIFGRWCSDGIMTKQMLNYFFLYLYKIDLFKLRNCNYGLMHFVSLLLEDHKRLTLIIEWQFRSYKAI